jgi:hypothetical protein
VNVATKPIELGHCYGAALAPRFAERRCKLGAPVQGVSALTCLDLHEHASQLKALRCSEAGKGLSLCFDPQAGAACSSVPCGDRRISVTINLNEDYYAQDLLRHLPHRGFRN